MFSLIYALILVLFILVGILFNKVCKSKVEHMTDMNNEALSMLASIYNKKKLIVDELEVKGKITTKDIDTKGKITTQDIDTKGKITTPSAKIGAWEIRGRSMGIPGSSDLTLGGDKWLRNHNYGTSVHGGGGFAGKNLWCNDGNLWAKNIFTPSIKVKGQDPLLYLGEFRISHERGGNPHNGWPWVHVKENAELGVWRHEGASTFQIQRP